VAGFLMFASKYRENKAGALQDIDAATVNQSRIEANELGLRLRSRSKIGQLQWEQ